MRNVNGMQLKLRLWRKMMDRWRFGAGKQPTNLENNALFGCENVSVVVSGSVRL